MKAGIIAFVGMLAVLNASAQELPIKLWYGVANDVFISQDDYTITILRPGTFKFESTLNGQLQWINAIGIDPTCPSGEVHVTVARSPSGGNPGATDVRLITLDNVANVTGVIDELNLSGELGADGDITANKIAGPCTVGGDVAHDLHVQSLFGHFVCAAMSGDITVTSSAPPPPGATPTQIEIAADAGYGGTNDHRSIDVAGDLDWLWIHGPMYGSIHVGGNAHALNFNTDFSHYQSDLALTIDGNLTQSITWNYDFSDSSSVWIGGNWGGTSEGYGAFPATTVMGDFVGSLTAHSWPNPDSHGHLGGLLVPNGDLSGVVQISGDLRGPVLAVNCSGWLLVGTDPTPYIGCPGGAGGCGRILEAADIYVTSMAAGSRIWASQGIQSKVGVGGEMRGSIRAGELGDLTGKIEIGGNMRSGADIRAAHLVDVNNDLLLGHITVNGTFGISNESPCTIVIDYTNPPTSHPTDFIAFNYNGPPPFTAWTTGSTVTIGGTTYTSNTAAARAARVWGITNCRGDMNGDGVVSTADYSILLNAIASPSQYAWNYPGLYGSIMAHADLNCDGSLNSNDPGLFQYYIGQCTNGCISPGGGNDALPPDQLAVELAVETPPEDYSTVQSSAVETATEHPDDEVRAYWTDVFFELP